MKHVLSAIFLVSLLAPPVSAAFTGSLYWSHFENHHVYRLDVQNNVAGSNHDLVALPGADGMMYDPLDANRILVGGQNSMNVFSIPTDGGSYLTRNASPITSGAFHLASYPTIAGAPAGNPRIVVSSGYDVPVQNSVGVVDLFTGATTNHLISGISRVSGLATRGGTLYASNTLNPGENGGLYTLDLIGNTATPYVVAGSHDVHGLWIDKKTGWLLAAGKKHLEAIDLNTGTLAHDWDLSSLIPESPSEQGFIEEPTSDGDGNVFVAANSGQIIYLDLNAANPQPVVMKNVGVGLDHIIAGPTAAPEPASLLLAGLGLVVTGAMKRFFRF